MRRWKVRERLVDDSRMARLSIADVELPDGVRFEQYVIRTPRAAVVVVRNNLNEILMLARGAEHTGQPADVNEAERIEWVPLGSAFQMIERGAIVGSASMIAVLYLRAGISTR